MKSGCSIVITAYNAHRTLRETLDSVLAQTFSDYEVWVVNDCSTDDTRQIIEEYMHLDARVHLLNNEKNLGAAESRNCGMQQATGEYIAFLDSDDVWLPEKLEKQIAFMEKTGSDIGYCSYRFIDEEGQPIKKPYIVPARTDYKKMLGENVIGLSTAMIRGELKEHYRMRADFYCEDYVFWMDLLKDGKVAAGLTEVLSLYRIRQDARSSNKKHVAKMRYRILRRYLKLNFIQAFYYFMIYFVKALKKYFR